MSTQWTTSLALREDGARVAVTDATFEWWYFDMIFDDGSTCVLNFLNKPPFVAGPLSPILEFNISPPSGAYLQEQVALPPDQYEASTAQCSLRMSGNWVRGDLQTYELYAEAGGMLADLRLTTGVRGWRLGPFLPPDQAAQQWLGEQVVIPAGIVEGSLFYQGAWHPVRGTCYHDHQWGGGAVAAAAAAGPVKLTSWYWGSVRAGEHAAWFAQILGSVGGGPVVPVAGVFTWAREGGMAYDDDVTALVVTPRGGDPVAGGLDVVWTTNQGPVRIELPAPREIARLNDGKYLRFLSPATVRSEFQGESFGHEGPAIWEINYL